MARFLTAVLVLAIVGSGAWIVVRTPDGAIDDLKKITGNIFASVGNPNPENARPTAHIARQIPEKIKSQTRAICAETLSLVDDSLEVLLLREIAQTQALALDVGGAVATSKRISDLKYRSTTLADVALLLSVGGKIPESISTFQLAHEAARDAEYEESRVVALSYLAEQQHQSGSEAAKETLQEAINIALHFTSNVSNAPRYWKIISLAQASLGDLSSARATLERIPAEGFRSAFVSASRGEVYVAIARAHLKAKDKKNTVTILNAATIAVRAEYDGARVADSIDIASVWFELGDGAAARRILSEVSALARSMPDDEQGKERKLSMQSGVATSMAGIGDLGSALPIEKEMPDKFWQARTLAFIASAMKGNKSYGQTQITDVINDAISVAKSVGDHGQRGSALATIARIQAEVGDVPQALATARSISDSFSRADALIGVGRGLSLVKNFEGAIAAVQEALGDKALEAGLVAEWKIDLAEIFAMSGDIVQALATARGISPSKERAQALSRVARVLIQCSGSPCESPSTQL